MFFISSRGVHSRRDRILAQVPHQREIRLRAQSRRPHRPSGPCLGQGGVGDGRAARRSDQVGPTGGCNRQKPTAMGSMEKNPPSIPHKKLGISPVILKKKQKCAAITRKTLNIRWCSVVLFVLVLVPAGSRGAARDKRTLPPIRTVTWRGSTWPYSDFERRRKL